MPGIVSMDRNGAQGASLGKHDDRLPAPSKLNGELPLPPLDGPAETNGRPVTNGAASSSHSPAPDLSQLPPELAHFTDFYMPFGKLTDRVAQETHNSLGEVLDKMANTQIAPGTPAVNGINGHMINGNGPSSAANYEKKSLILNWAWGEREKFVKLLVLSKWSRHCDDVSKMIDLNVWLNEQFAHYDEAPRWIGQLKLNVQNAKAPNPDLKTALEVLSAGKVPWVPDLGYIPPEPLTPQQMLKTITNVNALLAIRINLHEELPRQMKDWSIAAGRATFVVPSEFELDVSIADEDPASPFFVVDVRFLFSPKPEVPDDWFRDWVEPEANLVLANSGLNGCYNWLHGFVLTHKLTTLKAQAEELGATAWANSIYSKQIHRSLIVQYWVETPGAKSWIEIGISSGKPKNGKHSWRGPDPPQLSLRWTRKGVSVEAVPIKNDWADLSLEGTVKAVIALHTNFILGSIRDQLSALSQGGSGLSLDLTTSTTEPTDCCLTVKAGNSSKATEVRIDAVSGRLSLRPPTARSMQAEHDINLSKDIAVDAASRIEMLICTDLRIHVDKVAENAGWTRLRHINIRRETTSAAVQRKVVAQSFYHGQGWKSNWVIGLAVNLDGESWWLFELADGRVGNSIRESIALLGRSMDGRRLPLSQSLLHSLERFAVTKYTFCSATKELNHARVPHVLRLEKVGRATPTPTSGTPVLYIKTGPLLGEQEGHKNWTGEILKLYHCGFDAKSGRVVHVVRGEMLQGHMDLKLVSSHNEDVSFDSKGAFSIVLQTAFGEPFMDRVVNRLKRIERLGSIIDVVKEQKLHCEHISLSRIVFRYAGKHNADIRFPEGSDVQLAIAPDNPHRRVVTHLNFVLNSRDSNEGFVFFMRILSPTLPLLRGLDAIERNSITSSSPLPSIHPRSLDWYRVSYESPQTTFDIRLRSRHDIMEWHVNDTSQNVQQRPPEFATALKELFRQKGEKWQGVRTGIIAEIDGIEDALVKLDDVVKKHQSAVQQPGVGSPPGTQTQQQQPPTNQQQKPQPMQQRSKAPQMSQKHQAKPGASGGPEIIMLD